MEAHQQLKEWLNSRQDYARGLELAKAQGLAGSKLTLLDSGENEYTRTQLRKFLQTVLDRLSAQVGAPVARPLAPLAPAAPAAAAKPAPEPAELVEVRRQRTTAFKLGNDAFTKMKVAPAGEPRKALAVQVKQHMRENARLWAAENYYLQFGFLPPVELVATVDRSDLRAVEKRRNTLRTYISHAIAGTRGKSDPGKRAAWQAELLELDLLLEHG